MRGIDDQQSAMFSYVTLERRVPTTKIKTKKKRTLGADTQYQDGKFVQELREREVAPHIGEYTKG